MLSKTLLLALPAVVHIVCGAAVPPYIGESKPALAARDGDVHCFVPETPTPGFLDSAAVGQHAIEMCGIRDGGTIYELSAGFTQTNLIEGGSIYYEINNINCTTAYIEREVCISYFGHIIDSCWVGIHGTNVGGSQWYGCGYYMIEWHPDADWNPGKRYIGSVSTSPSTLAATASPLPEAPTRVAEQAATTAEAALDNKIVPSSKRGTVDDTPAKTGDVVCFPNRNSGGWARFGFAAVVQGYCDKDSSKPLNGTQSVVAQSFHFQGVEYLVGVYNLYCQTDVVPTACREAFNPIFAKCYNDYDWNAGGYVVSDCGFYAVEPMAP